MGRSGAICGLGLVLGLSGCAGAGQRLAARPSVPERGTGSPYASRWRREPLNSSPRLAARERTAADAPSSPPNQGASEGLNRFFPSLNSRRQDAPPAERGASAARTTPSGPEAPLPPPSDYRSPATLPDEAAMEHGEPPVALPVALTVPVYPDPRRRATVGRRPEDRATLSMPPLLSSRSRPFEAVPDFALNKADVNPTSAEIQRPSAAESGSTAAGGKPSSSTPIAVPTPSPEADAPPPALPVEAAQDRAATSLPVPAGSLPGPGAPMNPLAVPAPPPLVVPAPPPLSTLTVPAPPPLPTKQLPCLVQAAAARPPASVPTIPPRPPARCQVVTKYWGLGLFGLVRSQEHLHSPDCRHHHNKPQSQPQPQLERPPRTLPWQMAQQAPSSLFPPTYFACPERKPAVPTAAPALAVAQPPAPAGAPEPSPPARFTPTPRTAPPQRVSILARIRNRIHPTAERDKLGRANRDYDTVPASLRGEPRDVAQVR